MPITGSVDVVRFLQAYGSSPRAPASSGWCPALLLKMSPHSGASLCARFKYDVAGSTSTFHSTIACCNQKSSDAGPGTP